MSSKEFQSQTAAILASLQQKISKYLTPSYEIQDIFDKSKYIKKDHEKAIQSNKQFVKNNQKQAYQRNQQQGNLSQFDQLMQRTKLCETKLHQMLFDHQVLEPFQGGFLNNNKLQQQSKFFFRPYGKDLMTFSTLNKVKSQITLPLQKEPNFFSIEKELHKMQKKIHNLQKKMNQKNSKNQIKEKIVNQSRTKVTEANFISTKNLVKLKSQDNLCISKDRSSSRKKQYSLKKGPSEKIIKKNSTFLNQQNFEQVINRHKNYKCQQKNDQTSLKNKLIESKRKAESKTGMNDSKLRKVGKSKFNEYSKKNVLKVNKIQQQKDQEKTRFYQKYVNISQNRIKLNLLKTQSQQVL